MGICGGPCGPPRPVPDGPKGPPSPRGAWAQGLGPLGPGTRPSGPSPTAPPIGGWGGELDSARQLAGVRAQDQDVVAALGLRDGRPLLEDLAEAILAHGAEDYAKVVEIMMSARYRMLPLGGSWAQRDVWERMLLHATLKDGQHSLARVLLAERTDMAPTSGPNWNMYAEALEACSETAKAESARAKGAELLAA